MFYSLCLSKMSRDIATFKQAPVCAKELHNDEGPSIFKCTHQGGSLLDVSHKKCSLLQKEDD